MNYYVHNVPGRLRVKIPTIKKNPKAAEHVIRLLGSVKGITSTSVKTVTGSIIVNYDPDTVSPEKILCDLKQKGYFNISKATTNDQYIHDAVSMGGKVIWKAIFGVFAEKAFKDSGLSILAALI